MSWRRDKGRHLWRVLLWPMKAMASYMKPDLSLLLNTAQTVTRL